MNVKKYLKQQSKRDRREILEADNGETLRALGVNYPPTPQKQKILKRWLVGSAGVLASIIFIVCIIVFYPAQQQVEYIDANFESRVSTTSELNSELHDFTFAIDETIYSVQVTRTNDCIGGDVLYYRISLDSYDSLISMEIVAVCNPRFNYSTFSFASTTPKQTTLSSYKILYESDIAPNPQYGLDTLSCIAEIDGKNDKIYVTKYTELLVGPEPAFFDVIQEIILSVTNK